VTGNGAAGITIQLGIEIDEYLDSFLVLELFDAKVRATKVTGNGAAGLAI
jgi:hypothetical protein